MNPRQNPFFQMTFTKETNLVNLIETHMVNTDDYIHKKHLREFVSAMTFTKVLDDKFINSKNFKDALWRICIYKETTDGSNRGYAYLWKWAEVNFSPSKKETIGFFWRMCDIGSLPRNAISNLKVADVIRKVIYESEHRRVVSSSNFKKRRRVRLTS